MFERLINKMIFIIVTSLSNEEFLQLKKRNPRVFEKIYQAYKKKIYNFLIFKTGGNYDTAEDLFSETFQSALDSVHTLKSADNISAWLIQIAYRRFADMIRKKQREKKYTQSIKKDQAINVDFDQQLIRKEKILLMNIAMENIKPSYKQILTMKYMEDKPVKEIAEKMRKSNKAIESMLLRARDALKTEIRHISDGYL